MYPYVLWRLIDNEWKRIRSVGSRNIVHCSRYEKVLPVGKRP